MHTPSTRSFQRPRTLLGVFALTICGVAASTIAYAATPTCDLTRDLDIGMEGKDVLCLQQWLNAEGYTLTESGPGAPGAETERFGALTRDALARFQKEHSLTPALGFLGPKTRTFIHSNKVSKTTSVLPPESVPAGASSSADIRPQATVVTQLTDGDRTRTEWLLSLLESKGLVGSKDEEDDDEDEDEDEVSDGSFEDRVVATIEMMRDAEAKMKKGAVSAEQLSMARNNLEDAQEDLLDAIYAYFKGKGGKAVELIDDAENNAEDAFRDAGGITRDDETEDRIDDLEDAIDEAWDEIEARDDAGDDTEDAEELLTEAEALLEEAEEAFDEDDLDQADDLLDEVKSLIDDALDAVVTEDEEDAKKAIKRAQGAIDDAYDAISDAEDDGDEVDDAHDLLDEAEDFLEDAEDAYDDDEYADALKLAKKAEDRADDAVDAL